ncbi:type I methionyl aminopeptidase [Planctomicrobium sp. SH668]|uniref:type I methionyl aminopeptidase n=1 Tax=Planctomicrobium sp. SH668 TaxID=3448126 RepID=UPI003F5C1426
MRRLISFRKQNRLPLYVLEEEQEGLRAAGRFNAQLMDFLRTQVREGISTDELNTLAETYTRDHGHIPACLGYHGFPKSICTSVNEVICHGIPDDYVLKAGDIVNLDCTSIVDGWYGDSSETFLIEPVAESHRKLVQAAFDAMWIGIRSIVPFSPVFDIGLAISRFGRIQGYGVVENFQGHGIGRKFHQEPGVPHVPMRKNRRDILAPGVSFTIEPMLNLGTEKTHGPLADGWTVLTEDGLPSAQFEHQILMTEAGPEILTLTQNGPQEGHQF